MRNLSNYNPGRPELLCLRSRQTKPKITMDKEKITTARPNSRSPGQVREVQARDHDGQARSRRPGEDNGQPGEDNGRDDDGQARTTGGQARTTGGTTTARPSSRRPG